MSASRSESDDRRRFERLWEANHARVLGFIVRRIGDPDAAADVFSETFLVAWRRLDQVPDGEQARLWLFAVARRVLANHRRGEHRRVLLGDRLRDGLSRSMTPDALPAGESRSVAAFGSLSEADRELLSLSAWEGLNPGEIAAVLGCSRNAARIRLHRARQRLRDALAAAGDRPTSSNDPVAIPGGTR